jgi:hypothetical protein
MKITPLALPGRWRTSTRPATVTRRPDLVAVRASWRRMPRRASSLRRNDTGCAFTHLQLSRGLLFLRLMQQAVDLSPVPAKEILCARQTSENQPIDAT